MACRIGMKKKERKRERGRRDKERGREDNRLTSLEREDTRLGNTGPNAVRTVFEKKDFHCLFDGTIFDFLFFFKTNAVRKVQHARFEYLFRTRGNEKLVNFSGTMIRFDSIMETDYL